MDQTLIDTRANPRQANIDAETEIRELSLNDLDHVADEFLTFTFRSVAVTSISWSH
jgi:hypothetical protein